MNGATTLAPAQRAAARLLSLQQPDGHFVGELEGDTILESEYVLLLAYLGEEDSARAKKAAAYILEKQQADGGWSNYPDGPFEMSVSVKAYFALKLTGHDPDAAHMVRARERILANGGAAKCNSFTKFYLALLGQIPYAACPSVPAELVLLPRWAYVNLYAMSSWTRTIVVPLSLFSALKPVRQMDAARGIGELLPPHPPTPSPLGGRGGARFTWAKFFLAFDAVYKRVEPWLGPLRRLAMRRALAWMRERLADSEGLGAIFPPMVYTVIILRALGVADDDPEMRRAREHLHALVIEEEDTVRLQPCLSPVWDTALSLNALADAGLTVDDESVRTAVEWLLAREVRRKGDWSVTNPCLEPGGWFFEYRNPHYPDTDDTAMVLKALARTRAAEIPGVRAAVARGVRWLENMQNRDGGWAAFDRDIDRELLTKVPFADHNAMLDPSCPDITARVLEALGEHGWTTRHPRVRKALAFLEGTQDPRGCWPGRWGVNYIYGTWQVLCGLDVIGVEPGEPMVRRAADWLKGVQQDCGGWGESCASYDDPSLAGQGTPTASQTAWALLGLLAAGEGQSESVRAGVEYLTRTQREDGGWDEEPFTGTGFPKVFYLKYHLYSLYFPLMALARYERLFVERAASLLRITLAANEERAGSPLYGEYPCEFPLSLTTDMVAYMAKKKVTGTKRFPLVLMLEPLHACNLTCTGCGRIREYETTIKQKLSLEECFASVEEAGAPIVSICGGEPMIYPEIGALVRGILKRRKHIYLCTNGMFTKKKLHEFRPSDRFFFNVHLDGLEATHDKAVEREGVFEAAVEGIIAAKKAGFLVCTNTTIYKDTDLGEIDRLFAYLARLGVDGFLVSPAYGYTAVHQTNPQGAAEIFLTRDQIREKFQEAQSLFAKHRMMSSPIYLEFLSGKRELQCTAWGNPTRNVKGWKGPCYLITDAHHSTFRQLIDETDWGKYGHGNDPRCEHCLVHSGYEASAALGVNGKLGDSLKMLLWQMT